MKKIKLGVMIIIAVILSFAAVYTASADSSLENYDYGRFSNNIYAYDIGGHFSPDIDLNYASEILAGMESKYGVTYTFIIVDDYSGEAIELADYIWANAGYGDDYISAVITTGGRVGERDAAVYTQGRGINIMNDNYVDGMLDSMLVALRIGDWDGAFVIFIDLAEKMTVSYNNNTSSVDDIYGNTIYASMSGGGAYYTEDEADGASAVLWAFIVGIPAAVIAVMLELAKHKPVKKAVHADYYVKDGDAKMSLVQDSFLRSKETRVKISSPSGSGGGGRGSGGTSVRSSGRSSGGGSRRF
ncbi:MAG: TPM domain-containing protein [Oscillospiraceae bacterium]|nr:TPM domain-containing protein [Oscillospiraceae bacterium]